MRELKFRAFNGKYMDEVVGYEYNCGSFDKDVTIVFDEKEGINAYLTKDLNVMQYIGLQDKNGKEIYAGDIVNLKVVHWNNCHKEYIENEEKHTGVIERCLEDCIGYGFAIKEREGDGYVYLPLINLLGQDYEIEVIGNIYENKELLEM